MKKSYFTLLFFVSFLFCTSNIVAQNQPEAISLEKNIEGLNIYPNPINSAHRNFLTIQSRLNLNKTIEFYDVLGKQLFSTVLQGKQLNISNLNAGVYILKITENNISEARKLIIK